MIRRYIAFPKAVAIIVMLAACGCRDAAPAPIDTPAATTPLSIDVNPPAGNPAAASETKWAAGLDTPTSKNPVVFRMAVLPEAAAPGDILTVAIQAKVAPNWHIYAVDQPTGMAFPTDVELQLPPGVTAETEWANPEVRPSVSDGAMAFVYEGDFVFQRKLKVAESAMPGTVELECEVTFQACNDVKCLAPKTIPLRTTLKIDAE